MSTCAQCGLPLADGSSLCRHHPCAYGGDWAETNRIICDFLHRGKLPERLPERDREDDFWAHAGDVA